MDISIVLSEQTSLPVTARPVVRDRNVYWGTPAGDILSTPAGDRLVFETGGDTSGKPAISCSIKPNNKYTVITEE